MKTAHIPLETLNAVVAILAELPHKHVAQIMRRLDQDVKVTEDPPPESE